MAGIDVRQQAISKPSDHGSRGQDIEKLIAALRLRTIQKEPEELARAQLNEMR